MQRLLEKLNGLSVDGYSCRQDMEEEFDNIFSEITAAGKETNFPAFLPRVLTLLTGQGGPSSLMLCYTKADKA